MDVTKTVGEGKAVDVLHMDFSKALDMVGGSGRSNPMGFKER